MQKIDGKPKAYVSLPISGRDIEDVQNDIDRARRHLEGIGYEAVSPLEGLDDYDGEWLDYIIRDLAIVKRCDALYLAGGTESLRTSRGVLIEYTAAQGARKVILR